MRWQLPVLVALVALGIALEALGVVDWRLALEWARGHAGGWWLPATIVLAQLALYTFAQPGSILFWVAALLYSPPAATLILTAGGTSGALGAYLLARRLTRRDADRARERRVFRLLERQGDFFTLCALRVLPGIPHSVINYASGMLALPLLRFLAATALGLAVKSYVYSSALGGASGAAAPSDLMRLEVLGPLILIALLLLLGRFALTRAARKRGAPCSATPGTAARKRRTLLRMSSGSSSSNGVRRWLWLLHCRLRGVFPAQFYSEFPQVEDDEVVELLKKTPTAGAPPAGKSRSPAKRTS